MTVYNVRPYTFEIIIALEPFFELVAISNVQIKEISKIIDFLEKILNLPIKEKNK